jgi:hypothetical protein
MLDGHLNKCIECCKSQAKEREGRLRATNPEWVEKDRERGREKYYRLGYITNRPTKEIKKKAISNYMAKYPEKGQAKNKSSKLKPVIKGNQLHHWSYSEQHYKDVIELSVRNHRLLHRNMTYDKELFMYRDKSGRLLDTKQSHIDLLNSLL